MPNENTNKWTAILLIAGTVILIIIMIIVTFKASSYLL